MPTPSASAHLQALTPKEFIRTLLDSCYKPPSRELMAELVNRYAALVDADVERASEEDALNALIDLARDTYEAEGIRPERDPETLRMRFFLIP